MGCTYKDLSSQSRDHSMPTPRFVTVSRTCRQTLLAKPDWFDMTFVVCRLLLVNETAGNWSTFSGKKKWKRNEEKSLYWCWKIFRGFDHEGSHFPTSLLFESSIKPSQRQFLLTILHDDKVLPVQFVQLETNLHYVYGFSCVFLLRSLSRVFK